MDESLYHEICNIPWHMVQVFHVMINLHLLAIRIKQWYFLAMCVRFDSFQVNGRCMVRLVA